MGWSLIMFGMTVYGAETYCPNLVGHYSGMVQLIPTPSTWTNNSPWHTQNVFLKDNLAEFTKRFGKKIVKFEFHAFRENRQSLTFHVT